jgi:hypothetical protein
MKASFPGELVNPSFLIYLNVDHHRLRGLTADANIITPQWQKSPGQPFILVDINVDLTYTPDFTMFL